ncbi:MAG: cupredoxin domain-containing protein [Deltaproteobacteria bacterium]|nr:cupredoxin domain-containing protein [Deltaproteobacteria bacterium]
MARKIFMMIFAASLLFSHIANSQDASFDIKAAKDRWEPSSITIKKGEKVSIKFISVDVDHAVELGEFGLKKVLIPEKDSVTLEFTATKTGTFSFPCIKYCSWRHLVGARPRLEIKVVE